MPKEQIRKRGKRKPKTQEDEGVSTTPQVPLEVTTKAAPEETVAGPSGIHPARAAILAGRRPPPPHIDNSAPQLTGGEQTLSWSRQTGLDGDYPFGVLNPDLKAYFRNVDDQIKDWEGVTSVGEEREDRQLFLTSVLGELRGNELTVSTDPDTAVVLERLLPSLGDWGRRVIGDAFGDEWGTLIRHRFGSHVVQTWLTLAADTLDREARGIYPPQHHAQPKSADMGVLPTMTDLMIKLVNLLSPQIPSLLTDPHASPPLRLLFIILSPSQAVPTLTESSDRGIIRSKRSGKYRKGQAVQGKSIFGDEEEKGKGKEQERRISEELVSLRKGLFQTLLSEISEVEWKSMGVNNVGSPAVQLLLEIETEAGSEAQPNSLLDILTEGLVTQLSKGETPTAQMYASTLSSTLIGSRLLETILRTCPSNIFDAIWTLYFEGKIGKLAGHPFANFVVAQGIARLDEKRVEEVVRECKAVAGGRALIKTARTSSLVALVNRSVALNAGQKPVLGLIVSALDLPEKDTKSLVPCLMTLKTYPLYQSIKSGKPLIDEDEEKIPQEAVDPDAEAAAAAAARLEGWKSRREPKPRKDTLEPNIQGCILLQAMVQMSQSNIEVLESCLSLDIDSLLEYSFSPIASRFLDVIVSSDAVLPKYRRRLISAFLGRYLNMAEDRLGSRVAETIWSKADGFMKEKIARSLIPDANTLASSQYGRFLANKLNLHLLERRPDEWRAKHLGVTGGKARVPPAQPYRRDANGQQTHTPTPAPSTTDLQPSQIFQTEQTEPSDGEKRKEEKRRKRAEEKDEIDNLFSGVEKKSKKKKIAA